LSTPTLRRCSADHIHRRFRAREDGSPPTRSGRKNPSPPRDCKAEAAHVHATRQGSHAKIVSALESQPGKGCTRKKFAGHCSDSFDTRPGQVALEAGPARAALEAGPARATFGLDPARVTL
jgi:hypothetical protein